MADFDTKNLVSAPLDGQPSTAEQELFDQLRIPRMKLPNGLVGDTINAVSDKVYADLAERLGNPNRMLSADEFFKLKLETDRGPQAEKPAAVFGFELTIPLQGTSLIPENPIEYFRTPENVLRAFGKK